MVIFLGLFLGILFMATGGVLGYFIGMEIFRAGPGLAILGGMAGFGLGAYVGTAIGRVSGLMDKVKNLEARISRMQAKLDSLPSGEAKEAPAMGAKASIYTARPQEKPSPYEKADDTQAKQERIIPSPVTGSSAHDNSQAEAHTGPVPAKTPEHTTTPPPLPPRPPVYQRPISPNARPNPVEQGMEFAGTFIRNFFTTGNVVARIGVIVLFFGVAFLLKYASTQYHVSIEYRFIGVAIFAMVLTGLGFRLRESKRVFALLLQGGGIGILYMTVYFAAKPYNLIPLVMAFGLMVLLVGLSGAVAVFQNARATAFMGMVGGFLAPVLTSSGAGQHVILFSYYAILGVGILGVSWYKSWRELNLLGFIFTFGVASLWGANNYRPELFASTEPFLILFFVFYETIAVLYALRQPLHLKGFVDGTLVFGTPIVVFAFQAVMVKHIEYGLAYSALGASIFYLILTKALWRKQIPGMQVLTESFLSLCVVFVSLAIPLGLSGKWTSAIYAFEGAGLIWIGLRQNRLLARSFGLLLQLGAGIFFINSLGHIRDITPVFNSNFLGFVFIALGGLFASYFHYKSRKKVYASEKPLHFLFLAWGVIWWLAGGLREAELAIPHSVDYWEAASYVANISLLFVTVTALTMHFLIKKLDWKAMGYALVGFVPALALFFWNGLGNGFYDGSPLEKLGWAAWPASLAAAYFILKQHEKQAPEKAAKLWHAMGFWIVAALAAAQISWGLDALVDGSKVWPFIAWGLIPALFAGLLLQKGDSLGWPVAWDRKFYKGVVLGPVLAFCLLWCIVAIVHPGDPAPLPYLPLINPLEIIQGFVLLVLMKAAYDVKKAPGKIADDASFRMLVFGLLWLLVFMVSNAVLARAVHYYAHIPFSRLGSSMLFQMALSLFWTLWAMAVTGIASKKSWRPVWFAGAALIGIVTLKLLFVDLSHSGALWRVGSFIGTGILMLVIGYTAPLPPQRVEEGSP
ncbi:MAG: DUF2339 domain-containing protein [Desulfatibacillum sp.]|nr:DUF2339 domain-containing protein [Desulfatibacillum sp.]